MNIKRAVRDFKNKYRIKFVTSDVIKKIIEEQGYTIIEFGKNLNDDNVQTLIDELELQKYIDCSVCFIYQDEKIRLLFLNRDLSDDESLVVLSHEEGHIWLEHVVKNSAFGQDVKQEFEANEFVHYLLKKSNEKKIVAVASILIVAGLIISGGFVYKHSSDTRVYTENYYRTESGTKYHIKGCVYLKNNSNIRRLSKEEFESGNYEPCSVCIQFEDK